MDHLKVLIASISLLNLVVMISRVEFFDHTIRFNIRKSVQRNWCFSKIHQILVVYNEVLKPCYFNIRKATGKERVVRHAKKEATGDAFCASLHRYFATLFREKIRTSLKLWIKTQIILPDYTLVSLFLPQTLESKHLWATKINIYSLR